MPGASPTHPAPTHHRSSPAATRTVPGRTHPLEPSMAKFVTPRLQLLSAAAGAAGARPMDATDLGYFEGDHPALRGRLARLLVCR